MGLDLARLSRSQLRVLHRIGLDEAQDGVPEQEVVLAVVVPPLMLVEIRAQMPLGDLVIGPDDRTVEQREHALDGVAVNAPVHPLAATMIDAAMRNADLASRTLVGLVLVGVERVRLRRDVFLDNG